MVSNWLSISLSTTSISRSASSRRRSSSSWACWKKGKSHHAWFAALKFLPPAMLLDFFKDEVSLRSHFTCSDSRGIFSVVGMVETVPIMDLTWVTIVWIIQTHTQYTLPWNYMPSNCRRLLTSPSISTAPIRNSSPIIKRIPTWQKVQKSTQLMLQRNWGNASQMWDFCTQSQASDQCSLEVRIH